MPSLLPHDLCPEWNASPAPGTGSVHAQSRYQCLLIVNLLKQALIWFKHNKIELFAVNENPSIRECCYPVSRKCHVDVLIDDHALFIPKKSNGDIDWLKIKTEIDRLSEEKEKA